MAGDDENGGGGDLGREQTVPSMRMPFGTEVVNEPMRDVALPSAPPVPMARETAIVEDDLTTIDDDPPTELTEDDEATERPPEPAEGTQPIDGSAHPPEAELMLDGVVLAERYLLETELGRGGMGSVYAGRHLTLDVPIAVKVMLPRFARDPHWLRRFEREAKVTSKLHHRNVVRVLDYGRHDGLPFLVMEMLEGVPLSDWLFARPAPPSIAEVERIMLAIFDAFEAAHAAGIVHRDLKPDNIFLATESDGEEVVKILDFGLAHMKEPGSATLTQADMVSGTPEYMSPEQCRTLKVGPAADIYALGCVLTEMLQLEPPFVGRTHVDVMTKQMFYEPPALRRGPDAEPIPPLLERLRLDMLAKKASARPGSVAEAKRRFIEAVSPEREAELLPGRKDGAPLGARQDRAPTWDERETPPVDPDKMAGKVGLWHLVLRDDGVDEMCVMALRMRGAKVVPMTDEDAARDVDLVVVDAGPDLSTALEITRKIDDGKPVIVCLLQVSAEAMSDLIAAGASAVLGYPIQSDKLTRKVRRQLARAQRPH